VAVKWVAAAVFGLSACAGPREFGTPRGGQTGVERADFGFETTFNGQPGEIQDVSLPGQDRPLTEVLSEARTAGKPTLLYFGASWCQPCKVLKASLLTDEATRALRGFVFQPYDAEAGSGIETSNRFKVHAYPTLIALDLNGFEVARVTGIPKGPIGEWLSRTAEQAALDDATVAKRLREEPDNLRVLWTAFERFRSRDPKEARRLLQHIEEIDHSLDDDVLSRAAWRLARDDIERDMDSAVRSQAADFIKRYPHHGLKAAWLLAGSGADEKTIEAAFAQIVSACPSVFQGHTNCDLRVITYAALAAGAPHAALAAAEKLVSARPSDALARLALAEAHNHLGEKPLALEAARKAVEFARIDGKTVLASGIEQDTLRFERGELHPDLPRPTLHSLVRMPAMSAKSRPPEFAAILTFSKSSREIAFRCLPRGGTLDEAYVRFFIGKGPKAEKVEILEPEAPERVRTCLSKAIGNLSFTPDAAGAHLVLPVSLHEPTSAFVQSCGRHPSLAALESDD
jgi:thiol-disulfide isomerase/thioredoxin